MRWLLLLTTGVLAGVLPAQTGWRMETASAEWTNRWHHNAITFNDRAWVFNGLEGGTLGTLSDLWSTQDGLSWTEESSALLWHDRLNAVVVEFDNRIWMFGGRWSGLYMNDVWSSPDGMNWVQETAQAPWDGRTYHTAAVLNGRLWVLGGLKKQGSTYSLLNDVWSSSDGVNWTQEVAAANWPARNGHATVAFNNKLWVLGGWDGQDRNDVWSSSDGINWTEETPAAGWDPRTSHAAVVFRNRMWVIGGIDPNVFRFRDVWSSDDGVNWQQEPTPPWSARHGHAAFVFRNRLWVHGGSGDAGIPPDDAWSYGMHIVPGKLGAGIIEVPYSKNLEVRLGIGPYTWSMAGGTLPPGLTADTSTTGATVNVSGLPTATGQWTFTMRVEDQGSGDWAEQEITLKINPQSSRADRTDDSGCANQPAPQIPAAILTAATATAALLRRRRVLG